MGSKLLIVEVLDELSRSHLSELRSTHATEITAVLKHFTKQKTHLP